MIAWGRTVADAEDGNLLALEVERREVAVDELVPRRARALRVSAGVPRGRADDQAIVRSDVLGIGNVDGVHADGLADVAGDHLRVACERKQLAVRRARDL